jgi:sec-independent protein translocase protein TatB
MFDIGGSELLLIAVVAVLVFGPQDIPKIMYNLGRIMRRVQYIRYAFSHQFEEFLKEHDLQELRSGVNFEAPEYDEAAADDDIIQDNRKTEDGLSLPPSKTDDVP